MAGTVVDEQNLVYKTVQQAIERAGHPTDLPTVLRYAAGKEKRTAIQDVLQHLHIMRFDEFLHRAQFRPEAGQRHDRSFFR